MCPLGKNGPLGLSALSRASRPQSDCKESFKHGHDLLLKRFKLFAAALLIRRHRSIS